jgi:hypothetical protein
MTFLGISLSTIIELAASIVVAAGTIFSGLVARQSVVEARKLRQMQDEPHIVVTLWHRDVSSGILNMWVENTGPGAAYDVKLVTDREIEFAPGKYLSQVGIFAQGISCFPPGHHLAFYIGEMSKMRQDGNRRFTVSATYRNSRKTPYTEPFSLNIESQSGMFDFKGSDPLEQIARSLSDMNNTLRTRA